MARLYTRCTTVREEACWDNEWSNRFRCSSRPGIVRMVIVHIGVVIVALLPRRVAGGLVEETKHLEPARWSRCRKQHRIGDHGECRIVTVRIPDHERPPRL